MKNTTHEAGDFLKKMEDAVNNGDIIPGAENDGDAPESQGPDLPENGGEAVKDPDREYHHFAPLGEDGREVESGMPPQPRFSGEGEFDGWYPEPIFAVIAGRIDNNEIKTTEQAKEYIRILVAVRKICVSDDLKSEASNLIDQLNRGEKVYIPKG
jgi:hypothetical protein